MLIIVMVMLWVRFVATVLMFCFRVRSRIVIMYGTSLVLAKIECRYLSVLRWYVVTSMPICLGLSDKRLSILKLSVTLLSV